MPIQKLGAIRRCFSSSRRELPVGEGGKRFPAAHTTSTASSTTTKRRETKIDGNEKNPNRRNEEQPFAISSSSSLLVLFSYQSLPREGRWRKERDRGSSRILSPGGTAKRRKGISSTREGHLGVHGQGTYMGLGTTPGGVSLPHSSFNRFLP